MMVWHVTSWQVRCEGGRSTLIIKLRYDDTIATVREYINQSK
jgi:hypothetical protein